MNDVLNTIMKRRSCRSFSAEPVPEELISQVVEAGLYAPNGGGRQDTLTLVVTDPEMIHCLARMNVKYSVWNSDPGYDPFYGAPVVMAVFGKKGSNTLENDASLVIGTMLLAAESLGLAGIWIHRAKQMFESAEGKEILRRLGISEEYEGVGHCVIGYAREDAKEPAPRKAGRVVYVR